MIMMFYLRVLPSGSAAVTLDLLQGIRKLEIKGCMPEISFAVFSFKTHLEEVFHYSLF